MSEKCCRNCKYQKLNMQQFPCSVCKGDGDLYEPTDDAMSADFVNHPPHYEGHTSMECIDVMEVAFGAEALAHFCLLNAFKYVWRHKHKNGLEDLEKAVWYLDRFDLVASKECLDHKIVEQHDKLMEMVDAEELKRIMDVIYNRTDKQPKLRIKYHADIPKLKSAHVGEWIDLYAAEDRFIPLGEYRLISLGVSIELPEGYEAIVAPRSSTFKNFGIICSCSFGVIDNLYKGDNDVWMFPAMCLKDMPVKEDYARRGTEIKKGDRIAQFRIQKQQNPVEFEEVELLGNPDRGGIGSTGKR